MNGGRYKLPRVYDPILGSHVRKICDVWSGLPVSWGRSKNWPKIWGMSKFLCWDHGFRLNIYAVAIGFITSILSEKKVRFPILLLREGKTKSWNQENPDKSHPCFWLQRGVFHMYLNEVLHSPFSTSQVVICASHLLFNFCIPSSKH